MQYFTYKVKDFETLYNAPIGFFDNDMVIIDNELQNDIAPDWDYTKGKISVTGILHLDYIIIFVAEKENDEDFKKAVSDEINKLGSIAPLFAFNRNMEYGNFKGDFNTDFVIKEIKPFNAKGWNKDKFFNTLRKRKVIPDIEIKDIFKGDANKCILNWKEYQESGDFQYIMDIVSHNINCLLKESVIQKNQQYFWDNWDIDGKGFMQGEK